MSKDIIRTAFLSHRNVSCVYQQLLAELIEKHGIDVTSLWKHDYLQAFLKQMMGFIYTKASRNLSEELLKQPKKTVILLNALSIRKSTSAIIQQVKNTMLRKGGKRNEYPYQEPVRPLKPIEQFPQMSLPEAPSFTPPIAKVPYVPSGTSAASLQIQRMEKAQRIPQKPLPTIDLGDSSIPLEVVRERKAKPKNSVSIKSIDPNAPIHEYFINLEKKRKARMQGVKEENQAPPTHVPVPEPVPVKDHLEYPWKMITVRPTTNSNPETIETDINGAVKIALQSVYIPIDSYPTCIELHFQLLDRPFSKEFITVKLSDHKDLIEDCISSLEKALNRSIRTKGINDAKFHCKILTMQRLFHISCTAPFLLEFTPKSADMLGFDPVIYTGDCQYQGTRHHSMDETRYKTMQLEILELAERPILKIQFKENKLIKKHVFEDYVFWQADGPTDFANLTIRWCDENGSLIKDVYTRDYVLLMKCWFDPLVCSDQGCVPLETTASQLEQETPASQLGQETCLEITDKDISIEKALTPNDRNEPSDINSFVIESDTEGNQFDFPEDLFNNSKMTAGTPDEEPKKQEDQIQEPKVETKMRKFRPVDIWA